MPTRKSSTADAHRPAQRKSPQDGSRQQQPPPPEPQNGDEDIQEDAPEGDVETGRGGRVPQVGRE